MAAHQEVALGGYHYRKSLCRFEDHICHFHEITCSLPAAIRYRVMVLTFCATPLPINEMVHVNISSSEYKKAERRLVYVLRLKRFLLTLLTLPKSKWKSKVSYISKHNICRWERP